MSEFDADTGVKAVAADVFAATVTDRWNALGARPNGGYLLGIGTRALGQVLAFPDPLVVSAYFHRPAVVGPARVVIEAIRS